MYKVVFVTNNPSGLLYQVAKGHYYEVENEVKMKQVEGDVVEHIDLSTIPAHPIRKALSAIGMVILVIVFTSLALLAALVLALVFLYGLVGAFARFDYDVMYLVGTAIIILLSWYGLTTRQARREKHETQPN